MFPSPGGMSKFNWGVEEIKESRTDNDPRKNDTMCRTFVNSINDVVEKAQHCIKYEFKDLDKLASAFIDETYRKVGTNKQLAELGHGIMRLAVQHNAMNEGIPNYEALNAFTFAISSHKLKDQLHEYVFYDIKGGKNVNDICLDAARAIIAVIAWEQGNIDEVVAAMQSFNLI